MTATTATTGSTCLRPVVGEGLPDGQEWFTVAQTARAVGITVNVLLSWMVKGRVIGWSVDAEGRKVFHRNGVQALQDGIVGKRATRDVRWR
jgi:hypothetical protein